MPLQKLKDFLDKENVKYVSIKHSSAYTAQEIAASAHIPGKELAKTVVVKINGKMAMAVLPASYKIDIKLLKEITGADNIRLADETEFKDKFPDCEVGAMPPFGNLYNIDVYAAQSLEDDEDIVFNACTHTELIKLAFKDYKRLVNPKIIEFAYHSKL
jgi:Ala-tRNA(Pro) deacylase